MAVEFSEKRRFKRVPLVFPVKGKWMETLFHSHIFQGKTLDMSNEGLCIKVDSSKVFKVGQEVKFKTWLYGDDFLEARGRVCWVHGLPDPDWPINMGVKIIRMRNDALWIERVQNRITEEAILGKDRGRSSGKKRPKHTTQIRQESPYWQPIALRAIHGIWSYFLRFQIFLLNPSISMNS